MRIDQAASIEHGKELVRAAVETGGFDAVVAAGGDSTIRGVASGLLGSSVPLGIIPTGTGNVLAREIGIWCEPAALAEVLLRGPGVGIRCGLADEAPFLSMAGAGFDAHVVERLSTPWKRGVGRLAYTWPVIREVLRKPEPFDVVIDGTPIRATWLVVTRVAHYGGSFVIAKKQTLLEDGFHAVLTTSESRRGIAGVLISMALGRLAHRGDVRIIPCKEVRLPGSFSIAVQVDGEPVMPAPRLLTLSDDRLKVIVPRQSPLAQQIPQGT